MTIPLGGVHVDVSLNVDQIGDRLRKTLQVAGERAGRDLERRLSVAGKRGGAGFASEFNNQAQKDLNASAYGRTFATQFSQAARTGIGADGVLDRRVAARMNASAGRIGRVAGESFTASFQRGLRGTQNRDLGFVLGRGLRTSTTLMVKFAGATGLATVGMSALVGAAAPLVNIAAGLGAGLIPATGALALIPAAGSAATASIATLTVGMQGLGDAFKEINKGEDADPEKLAKAMESLSPAARQVVTAFKELKPELTSFRQSVQESLLTGVGDQMERFGTTLLPALERGMTQLAGGLNAQFDQLFAGITSKSFTKDVDTFFTNATKGAKSAAPGIRSMVDALSDLTAVGSSFLPQFGRSFSNAADDFASFIDKARDSGDLKDFMSDGIDAVKQFGRIALDLGVGLVNTFQIAEEAGGGLFDQVERIADGFRDFTESARGQERLGTLFESLRRAGDAMAPVLGQIFDTFVDLSPVFADIAEKIGPKLVDIVKGIGDALVGVGPEIGDAFVGIGDALADILPALLGLAGPFATLLNAVLRPMVPVVEALAPILGFLADTLSAVLTAASDIGIGPLLGVAGAFLLLRNRAKGLATLIKGVGTSFVAFRGVSAAATGMTAMGTAMGVAAVKGGRLRRVLGKAGVAGLVLGAADAAFNDGDIFDQISDKIGDSLDAINVMLGGTSDRYRLVTRDQLKLEELAESIDLKIGQGGTEALSKLGIPLEVINRGVSRGQVNLEKMADALDLIQDAADGLDVDPKKLTEAQKFLQRSFDSVQQRMIRDSQDFWAKYVSVGDSAMTELNGIAATSLPQFGATVSTGIGGAALAVETEMNSIGTAVQTGLFGASEEATGFWTGIAEKIGTGSGAATTAAATGMASIGAAVAAGAAGAGAMAAPFGPSLGGAIQSALSLAKATTSTGMTGIGNSVASGAAAAAARAAGMSGPLGGHVRSAMGIANNAAVSGMQRLAQAIDDGAARAAHQASGLGGQIQSAIGSVDLYGVGYSMMNSLGLGIADGGRNAASQASGIAASIRGLFPASPAKWGPFAGQGHPEILGQKLMGFLAAGIGRGTGQVAAAARRGADAASGVFAGAGYGAGQFGGSSTTNNYRRELHAPINVMAPSADPRAVAAQVRNRLDTIAAQLAL